MGGEFLSVFLLAIYMLYYVVIYVVFFLDGSICGKQGVMQTICQWVSKTNTVRGGHLLGCSWIQLDIAGNNLPLCIAIRMDIS